MMNIVEVGGIIDGSFKRYIFTTLDKINETISKKNFTGDIYRTIYKYESEDIDNCNFIAPIYLDLDIDNIEENFLKIKLDLILAIRSITELLNIKESDIDIYFSGSKGFHVIIDENILGFIPGRTLNKDLKIFALKVKTFTVNKTVDTKIYDYKRLFRLENTINYKTGLYKVYITLDTIRSLNSYEELKEYAKEPKEPKQKEHVFNEYAKEAFEKIIEEYKEDNKRHINTKVAKDYIKKKKILPCVKYVLQNGSKEGYRNNTTVALAAALFQVENDFDSVLELIKEWNSSKNEIPLPESEILNTVSSAYRMANNGIFYGCSSFMDLDLCIKNCPIYKE